MLGVDPMVILNADEPTMLLYAAMAHKAAALKLLRHSPDLAGPAVGA